MRKLSLSSSLAKSKSVSCPVTLSFFLLFRSRSSGTMRSFCFLFPGILSSAPDFTKLSSVLRFTSLLLSRSTKSSSERKIPPDSRSLMISSDTAAPTLRMADRPKRIPSPETENPLSPSLTSGGRIAMPIWRQLSMYSATFPELSSTLVISAAINSFG